MFIGLARIKQDATELTLMNYAFFNVDVIQIQDVNVYICKSSCMEKEIILQLISIFLHRHANYFNSCSYLHTEHERDSRCGQHWA